MNVLVVGATGATGKWLVKHLLDLEIEVKAIVRSRERIPVQVRDHEKLTTIEASLLDLSDNELQDLVQGCSAVASCLGHNLSFNGVYGKPRRLVTDAVRRLCAAVKANSPKVKVKFVLMNTSGNRNRDLNESVSLGQRIVVGLLRVLLPPHPDNEQAAEHLRVNIGQEDRHIDWVAVRPDGLIDQEHVSEYELHPSPIRDAIFNAGKVSRINVAHFMAKLIAEQPLWDRWKGQMPVIYSKEQ